MTTIFDYPTKAAFGRILPKSKIYEHAGSSKGVKELFVRQMDQIIWKYKLAPETINLAATKAVSEIQIFHLTLKTGELKDEVLRCIDKAVPFPIIFELHYEDKCKAMACYKRPNEADSTKWVTSDYFGTAWLPQRTPRSALPVALNMTSLYESLLDPLLPHKALLQEAMAQRIKRMETIRWKEYEISQLELRLQREKQFNRKVEINAEIRAIKLEIEGLVTPQLASKS